jgi:ParB-like nuclease domain.
LSQTVYEIKTPSITLKITVAEANSLHIHEEVIPDLLSQLAEKIRSDGVLRDPVIVDEKTLILLDGVHRVAAVRHLGLKYIPVCLVDYDNPNIKIYTWSRVVKLKKPKFQRSRGS